MKKDLIYLTGFMGSGKSFLGPKLAKKLEYDFVDLDKYIIETEGVSIKTLFHEIGEPQFRLIERKCLEEVSGKHTEKTVFSLGGGTIMDNNALKYVKDKGILVYLKHQIHNLVNVLSLFNEIEDRPLLFADNNYVNSLNEIENQVLSLLSNREYYYEEAHIIVEPPDNTINNIIKIITRYA